MRNSNVDKDFETAKQAKVTGNDDVPRGAVEAEIILCFTNFMRHC